jgi:hypothetical protein
VTANATRIALAAALLAYVPLLAWISLVATPAYVTFPWLSAFAAPIALAVLALGVFRGARRTAWAALAVLGLWLAENVVSIYWHLVGWEQRQGAAFGDALVGALGQSVSRSPYWLVALLPLCVAGAYLWRTR